MPDMDRMIGPLKAGKIIEMEIMAGISVKHDNGIMNESSSKGN